MSIYDLISQRIKESIKVKESLLQHEKIISDISRTILEAYISKKKVILFGNGGSAADAQHIAAELSSKFYLNRSSLPAIALTANTSTLTAIGNDYSFSEIFSKQIEGLGNKGDVAIGISTSGDSENVIKALIIAKKKGLVTIGLTGESGGKMKGIVDLCLCIPSDNTPRIQEAHITVGHIICEIIEKGLFRHEE